MTADEIKNNILKFRQELSQSVTLVAVSKFHPIEALKAAYDAGQRDFGENRAQEIAQKHIQMPNDVRWHFIGHLQTNKVKAIVPYVTIIHSVDSLKLLELINKEAIKVNRVIDVLLQLYVAKEETKFGFSCQDCIDMVNSGILDELHNVRVCGVMGMATNTTDENEIKKEFKEIRSVYDTLKNNHFQQVPYFNIVSMGMSDDYNLAIDEGSTMVRIGTSIFGLREY